METSRNYLTGSFRDRDSAERAYNRLRERGYTDDEINIIMSDKTREKYFDKDKFRTGDKDFEKERERADKDAFGTKAMEGAGKGASIGGAVGAAAGIIAAIGTSLVIPGLGIGYCRSYCSRSGRCRSRWCYRWNSRSSCWIRYTKGQSRKI